MRKAAALAAAVLATLSATPAPAQTRPPTTLRDLRGPQAPKLETARAALVIIDAQREYVEGPLTLTDMPASVAEIVRLRAWAKAHGVPVIHIQQRNGPGSPIFAPGSRGIEFLPDLLPDADEQVVVKAHPNSFHATSLDAVLKRLGRDQLILTGFMTHMCLDATARAGFDLNYEGFVVASATADRPLPAIDGGAPVQPVELKRAVLAGLNDRFAWVLPTAAQLEAIAEP